MKKLIISLLVAMGLIGAVYGAAAVLVVGGVDDLGAANVTVFTPGGASVEVNEVAYVLASDDVTEVHSLTVGLENSNEASGETCDVAVNFLDGSVIDLSVIERNVAVAIDTNLDSNGTTTTTTITVDLDDDGGAASSATNLADADFLGIDADELDGLDITISCEN